MPAASMWEKRRCRASNARGIWTRGGALGRQRDEADAEAIARRDDYGQNLLLLPGQFLPVLVVDARGQNCLDHLTRDDADQEALRYRSTGDLRQRLSQRLRFSGVRESDHAG